MHFEILMDARENPRKCTILPLKERTDFKIRYFHAGRPISAFQSQLLLHVDGEDLSEWKQEPVESLGLIDCNWKKVGPAMQQLAKPLPRLVKIPNSFVTAYPRRNKEGKDPEEGLATIEALFIAAAFLGNWDETLFDKYFFKEAFLQMNESQWKKFRLGKK